MNSSLIYFLSFAISGLLQLTTLKLITLQFEASEFATYAILFSTSSFIQIFFFQWLRVLALRFENSQDELSLHIPQILKVFAWLMLLLLLTLYFFDRVLDINILMFERTLLAAFFLGINEISISRYRAKNQSFKYLIFSNIRYLMLLLAIVFYSPSGSKELFNCYLISLAAGCLLSKDTWQLVSPLKLFQHKLGSEVIKKALTYGAPLIISLSLTAGFIHMVKLLLSTQMSPTQLGAFSMRLDYSMYFIAMVFMVSNIISFNKIKDAYDAKQDYQYLMNKITSLVFFIGLIISLFMMLKPGILDAILLTHTYSNYDYMWQSTAIGILLYSTRIYLLDIYFYITGQTSILTQQAALNIVIFTISFYALANIKAEWLAYSLPLSQFIMIVISGFQLHRNNYSISKSELSTILPSTFFLLGLLLFFNFDNYISIAIYAISAVVLIYLTHRKNIIILLKNAHG